MKAQCAEVWEPCSEFQALKSKGNTLLSSTDVALLYIAWKPNGRTVYLQSLKQKLPMFANFGEFNSLFVGFSRGFHTVT